MLFNLLADANAKQADWTSYLMIGVLLVAIVGLFVWSSMSNKKKQKQAQEMLSNIKVGDKVKTIGGVCGYIAQIDDSENTFVLRTGMDGKECFVKFDKGAIYQTAPAKENVKTEQKAEEKATEEKVEAKSEEKKEAETTADDAKKE